MVVTNEEEIKRQHEQSIKLVEENLKFDKIEYFKEIECSWKEKPTITYKNYSNSNHSSGEEKDEDNYNNNEHNKERRHCVSIRGQLDISEIKDIIYKGYNNNVEENKGSGTLWDETRASKENILLTRPSHDSWGIQKIVLLFCDDFLQRVYEMPWWHDTTNNIVSQSMQSALQPVLKTLNITSDQIVRLLFACLPPGVTIPVHHDTGEWVKYTHRIHLPVIIDKPNEIVFRVGPADDALLRVPLSSNGTLFEINNQARHTVSNCSNYGRVHLILDYIDKNQPIRKNIDRVKLSPGETLFQTRRSIDRQCDTNTRNTPSFIIVGAQKGGTTSLYECIKLHPLFVPPKRRETHNLDWRWDSNLTTPEQHQAHVQSFYHTQPLSFHPSCLTGDSTPSYLAHPDLVIPRLKLVFPWCPQIIAILRNPVDRALSHYSMVTDSVATPEQRLARGTQWTNKSFEQVIQEEFSLLHSIGLIPYWDLHTQSINTTIFNSFVGSEEEDKAYSLYQQSIPMKTGSHSLLVRGMYELQLRSWTKHYTSSSSSSTSSQMLVINMEDLSHNPQCTMSKVFQFIGLPDISTTIESNNYPKKNTREYDPMIEDSRKTLNNFYTLYNQRLELLLGHSWKDCWL